MPTPKSSKTHVAMQPKSSRESLTKDVVCKRLKIKPHSGDIPSFATIRKALDTIR
jgi:hypothetical protein